MMVMAVKGVNFICSWFYGEVHLLDGILQKINTTSAR